MGCPTRRRQLLSITVRYYAILNLLDIRPSPFNMLRQFAKCDESVKLVLFSSFCSCYYCPYLWLDMTKHSARILRVAYNNAHRKF